MRCGMHLTVAKLLLLLLILISLELFLSTADAVRLGMLGLSLIHISEPTRPY